MHHKANLELLLLYVHFKMLYPCGRYLTISMPLFCHIILQDDELTILDVRKFKPVHKRKFNYEVMFIYDKRR